MQKIQCALIFILLLFLPGCAMLDAMLLSPPEDTAQELYEAGADAMQNKEYDAAADYFESLTDRYPFSPYAVQAELGVADARFLAGDYILAAEAYEDFEAMRPRHTMAEYVLFQIGVSNYMQFDSIDRPQTAVAKGMEFFNRLIEAFPESKYVPEAREYIVKSREIIAGHELYIADFYRKQKQWRAAFERYSYVVQNFHELEEVADYAEKYAQIAWVNYQKESSLEQQKELYGSWEDLFDWL